MNTPQHNDEVGVVPLPLSKGYWALIDTIDADLADFKWNARESRVTRTVYAKRFIYGVPRPHNVYLHRVILERVAGHELTRADEVDHINGNGLDNRRGNLRISTRGQNAKNRKQSKLSQCPYKGIERTRSGRYCARIQVDGNRMYLGSFDTPEAAYAAYCEAAERLHGEFARFE